MAEQDVAQLPQHLSSFATQCKEQLAFRYLAGRNGAYPVVFSACQLAAADRDLLLQALSTLWALLDGQPDLLDAAGRELLLRILRERRGDAEVTLAGLRCVRHGCLKHEHNRQDLVKAGILPLLTGAIIQHGDSADVVRTAASALRVMTFDDDIRVPFGHAHDHAKMIVLEHDGLRVLIEAAKGEMSPGGVGPDGELPGVSSLIDSGFSRDFFSHCVRNHPELLLSFSRESLVVSPLIVCFLLSLSYFFSHCHS